MHTNNPSRYSSFGQALHWLMAALVLAAFVYGPGGSELRVYLPKRDFERQLHETLGLCVFALLLLRIVWRAFSPPIPAQAMPRWMHRSSRVVQIGLYVLLMAVPTTAILGAWLEGHPLTLLGGVQVAPWLSEQHSLGSAIAEIHTWLGDAILWLAGAHAAAGLYHHWIRKDGVLSSMLPLWLTQRSQ
ncbi:cytochrome b [Rhodoferax aquaticus]|uniref:Cytochrome b n=1 Tax=Rhodoferax aquaticus TaxID=2527691 RepID=A0A515ELC7_9BURK|nr:cytochrome b [Rhodoferax aquaticus]QDL53465.1 cytochrome b [Rhodoferax aquaticus]